MVKILKAQGSNRWLVQKKKKYEDIDDTDIVEDLGNGFEIVKVAVKETWSNKERKIRKCVVGEDKPMGSVSKTLLLVGATGAGKSTLLDGIFNYVLGVKWNDDYRYKLISLKPEERDRKEKGQALSQTEWVTAYSIPCKGGASVLPYDLNIIDTPGFGDTRGIDQDQRIVAQMKYLFENSEQHGIYSLAGVCFVVQASLPRLTHTQKYIFSQILSLFGKDIEDNIFPLITFADGHKPTVLTSLEEAKIPCKKFFKFNNSSVFAKNTQNGSDNDDSDDDGDGFDKMMWNTCMKSYRKLFKTVEKTTEKSLSLSAEVLKKRDVLQSDLKYIEDAIKESTQKMARFEQEKHALQKYEKEIEKNSNFEFEVDEERKRKVEIPGGSMNCIECKKTCHCPCSVWGSAVKYSCTIFTWGANCKYCGHGISAHILEGEKYEFYVEKVKRTQEDIKARYTDAKKDKDDQASLLDQIEKDYEQTKQEVAKKAERARTCLEELKTISLKPDPLSGPDYIDLLIAAEKTEANPGFRERIEAFKKIQSAMRITEQVATGKTKFIQPLSK